MVYLGWSLGEQLGASVAGAEGAGGVWEVGDEVRDIMGKGCSPEMPSMANGTRMPLGP